MGYNIVKKEPGFTVKQTWVQIMALQLTSWGIWGKTVNICIISLPLHKLFTFTVSYRAFKIKWTDVCKMLNAMSGNNKSSAYSTRYNNDDYFKCNTDDC